MLWCSVGVQMAGVLVLQLCDVVLYIHLVDDNAVRVMTEDCLLHEECIVRMLCASDGCEGSRYAVVSASFTNYVPWVCLCHPY